MKKIITLFLSVIMCFSLSIVASAETQTAVTGTIAPTSIGQMYYPHMARYAKGKWGCTRWYNRVLTAEKAAANYAIDAEKYDET